MPQIGRCGHVPEERTAEIVNVQGRLLGILEVGIVSKRMNTDILQVWLSWKPGLGPEKAQVVPFAPCLDGAPSESVDEYNVYQRLRWRVQQV